MSVRLILLVALAISAACSMPALTRTGQVQDVLIRESLEPAQVTAKPGDEIRWVNRRRADVRLVFIDPIEGRVNCRRGLGGMFGSENSVKLAPDESASLCFATPGSIRYVVRAETAAPTGEANIPGTVHVVQSGS